MNNISLYRTIATLGRLTPCFIQALLVKARLKTTKKVIMAFGIPSMGELQFIKPIIMEYTRRNPESMIVFIHQNNTIRAFKKTSPSLAQHALHLHRIVFELLSFSEINLFLTSEQYDLGLNGIYSITTCHGQAAKGLSFVPGVIDTFDALFLNGPIHREAFDLFVADFLNGTPPAHMELFEIGYPKSDNLLNGLYSRKDTENELNLDVSKKTVLYAPAFNEGASLRECGLEVIELLARQHKYNVIVKLPVDCWNPTSNYYATGGVNWFEKIRELEAAFPDLRLFSDYQIDPLLDCADVLVTCISSVSFEFLALSKPVIFINTPKYFTDFLQKRFPDMDISSWAERNTVNGGKEFGLTIDSFHDLPDAIDTVLANPENYPRRQEKLKNYLLYNRGHASKAAVDRIEELLNKNVKTKRPAHQINPFQTLMDKLLKPLSHQTVISIKKNLQENLQARGYKIAKTGQGYLDATKTVKQSKSLGLSVCEYLENNETDPRKHGRRDRIIDELKNTGILKNLERVCEIGTGTGQYLEKIIELSRPSRYDVYETDPGWVKFLQTEYNGRNGCKVICHPADGRKLSYNSDNTCDFVHAHGVFVYLPLLQSLEYLKECARVCRPGGFIVFDYYPAEEFNLAVAEEWLKGPHRFPVVIPETLLDEFTQKHQLQTIHKFLMIHGSGQVTYIVWQKPSNND